MSAAVRLRRHPGGIVELVLDRPDRPVNVLDDVFTDQLSAALDVLEPARAELAGVVLTAPKPTFLAGGDLDQLVDLGRAGPAAAYGWVTRLKGQLRRLEALGRPVVAALGGSALGGGLELALACHHGSRCATAHCASVCPR